MGLLSRLEQKIQKRYPALGIVEAQSISILVALCKGQIFERETYFWFWDSFIGRTKTDQTKPKTAEEIYFFLRNATWITEDDIIQEILFSMFRRNIYRLDLHKVGWVITRDIRDYLITTERVFSRQSKWKEDYIESQLIDSYNIEIGLFDQNLLNRIELPPYLNYLCYLSTGLGLHKHQIKQILLESPGKVANKITELKQLLRDLGDQNAS